MRVKIHDFSSQGSTPLAEKLFSEEKIGSNMSQVVECHHDPEILRGCVECLDVVGTLENAFLKLLKTDS